jgi:hypothetical protein
LSFFSFVSGNCLAFQSQENSRNSKVLQTNTCIKKAYRIAQKMRCDRYAECSALTGELINEPFEDIGRVAAMTRTENGGQTQRAHFAIM